MAEAMGQNPRILRSGRHDRAFYAAMWAELLGAVDHDDTGVADAGEMAAFLEDVRGRGLGMRPQELDGDFPFEARPAGRAGCAC